MDLIALAVPVFLLALLVELLIDWRRQTGYYRSNDAINSISTGILRTTFGYFTRFLPVLVWGFVLQNLAPFRMPLEWFDASPRGIVLWLVAAVAWDFCYYWFHRYSHEISVLWAAHAVHHQSEDYNLSTALRQTATGFIYGWIFYLPMFLAGFPLEVVLTVSAANLIYQFWVHTQLVRRLGPLEKVLMTPSHHRVHHGQNERYIDKNYGGVLIAWDKLFGSFQEELDEDPVVFGVRKPLANWNPFWANLQVYDYLLFDARKARRWRDKIAVWFRRTGWRPPDVERRYPKGRPDLAQFRKFDPVVAPRLRRYTLFQFLVAMAASMWIASLYASGGAAAVIWPCVFLWVQLYTIGLLNEGRKAARGLEVARLLLLGPLLLATMRPMLSWIVIIAYTVVSMLWLLTTVERKQRSLA